MSYLAQCVLSLRRNGEGRPEPALRTLKIKLTERCNLRCSTCSAWRRPQPQELSSEQVVELMHQARALGCERIHFSGGEPLLRSDTIELLEQAKGLGLRPNLTTNATLMTRSLARALVRAGARWVAVSIDSPEARVHDRIRGHKGAFRKAVAGIDLLLAAGARVRINTVVSSLSWNSLVEMPAFLTSHPVHDWLLLPVDARQPGDPSLLSPEEIARFNVHVAPRLRDKIRFAGFDPFVFGLSDEELEAAARQHYARGFWTDHQCLIPWIHSFVDSAGDVFPCCMTHRTLKPLGNLQQTSLAELFLGSPLEALRDQLLKQPLESCLRCDDYLRALAPVTESLRRDRGTCT